MARFSALYSSSKGNCIFIGGSGGSILIDAGVSAKKIEYALTEIGEQVQSVQAIFVTHEHSDHINGLRAFAGRYGIRVYSSAGTLDALDSAGCLNNKFETSAIDTRGVEAAGMKIVPFHTCHDCSEGFGYVINTPDDRKIAVATDLGHYSDEIKAALTGCDLVMIESNYDKRMLMTGPYPQSLKHRISSGEGHLSNDECADATSGLISCGTTRFVLGHISADNNLPELAYKASLNALCATGGRLGCDFTLDVAPRLSPMKKIIF
ncbi:MAG: MBL fold metallo-hydrolase [Clostridia bacterium]|nr:MBL fold metallo-hydrolase [Clostridia bacterium]